MRILFIISIVFLSSCFKKEKPFELPILKIHSNVDDISHYKVSDFELIGYQSHPIIKLPLSN
jgi:thymidylate synthase